MLHAWCIMVSLAPLNCLGTGCSVWLRTFRICLARYESNGLSCLFTFNDLTKRLDSSDLENRWYSWYFCVRKDVCAFALFTNAYAHVFVCVCNLWWVRITLRARLLRCVQFCCCPSRILVMCLVCCATWSVQTLHCHQSSCSLPRESSRQRNSVKLTVLSATIWKA